VTSLKKKKKNIVTQSIIKSSSLRQRETPVQSPTAAASSLQLSGQPERRVAAADSVRFHLDGLRQGGNSSDPTPMIVQNLTGV
jgi:hypothetical protein